MSVQFVQMVHPEVEGVGSVPETAVGQYTSQGWRLKSDADAEAAAARKSTRTTHKES